MNIDRMNCLTVGAIAALCLPAFAGQPASFSVLAPLSNGAVSDRANAISPDGLSVTGTVYDGNTNEGFVWSQTTGRVMLGRLPNIDILNGPSSPVYVTGVSNGSTRVIGSDWLFDAKFGFSAAFQWTPESNILNIPDLSGGVNDHSFANGVSLDGTTVVGGIIVDGIAQAAMWTEMNGWNLLGDGSQSGASDISNDGTVIVGSVRDGGFHGYRWTAETGMIQIEQTSLMRHTQLSGDGETIVGHLYHSQPNNEPFKWTQTGGIELLPHPKNTFGPISHPKATSIDGTITVGSSRTEMSYVAVIWDKNGVRTVQDALEQAGLDLTGWFLNNATGISDDGLTIVGSGTDPSGVRRAWIATLPPANLGCNPADLAEPYGQLNFFDVSAFLSAFTANDSIADINADGLFNFFDVSDFITTYNTGCP